MGNLNSRLFKPKLKLKSKLEGATIKEETQDQAWLCHGPCLMVCHIKVQTSQLTLYDASQQMHHTKASQEFSNMLLCGSQGDWVLSRASKNASDCSIVNAVTMEKFHMPTLGEYELSLFDNFLLYGSPHGTNCTVFVINSTEIFYCKIGANEFSQQDMGSYFSPLDRAITIFQGKMFYIDNLGYYLNSAQLQESMPLQFEECIDGYELEHQLLFEKSCYHYLFESNDRLLYVHGRSLEMGVKDFQVFRADLCGKVWEEIHDIGSDRAIFIDEFRGFSAPVQGLLKGNCIYYKSGLEDDCNLNIFSYDLKDGSVTTLPPPTFEIHFWKKSHTLQSIWINCSPPN